MIKLIQCSDQSIIDSLTSHIQTAYVNFIKYHPSISKSIYTGFTTFNWSLLWEVTSIVSLIA